MKQLILATVAVLGAAISAAPASAAGCSSPFCQGPGVKGALFKKQPMPAFQAAPWYLYWPYNAHFMTPSPLQGPYYAPPPAGGMMNPYFPAAPIAPAFTPAP